MTDVRIAGRVIAVDRWDPTNPGRRLDRFRIRDDADPTVDIWIHPGPQVPPRVFKLGAVVICFGSLYFDIKMAEHYVQANTILPLAEFLERKRNNVTRTETSVANRV